MTRKKILAGMCVFMFIIWAVVNRPDLSFIKVPKASSVDSSSSRFMDQDQESAGERKLDILQLTKYMGLAEDRRSAAQVHDPFQKIEAERASLEYSDLVLSGIMVEEGEQIALINNQIFRKGDAFSGFEVVEITESEVVLQKGLEKYVLKLFSAVGIEEEQNAQESPGY